MLLEEILKGVDDSVTVGSLVDMGPSPIGDLIADYVKIQKENPNLPAVDDDTTGAELKSYIAQVPPVSQIKILNRYTEQVKSIKVPTVYEPPAERDKRKLKIFLIKTITIVICALLLMVVGFTLAISVMRKEVPDTAITTGLFNFATEIIKVFIGL